MGTSLMAISVHTTTPPLHGVARDFVPIARIGVIPLVAVASASPPFETWTELVANLKDNAGKVNCATSGKGSSSHAYTEMLERVLGFEAEDVPYKNVCQAVTDTATGINHFFIANLPPTRGPIQSGQLRPVGRRLKPAPAGLPRRAHLCRADRSCRP